MNKKFFISILPTIALSVVSVSACNVKEKQGESKIKDEDTMPNDTLDKQGDNKNSATEEQKNISLIEYKGSKIELDDLPDGYSYSEDLNLSNLDFKNLKFNASENDFAKTNLIKYKLGSEVFIAFDNKSGISTIYGKKAKGTNDPKSGVVLGTILGLPNDIVLAQAQSPMHTKNDKVSPSKYIYLDKDAQNTPSQITLLIRLFNLKTKTISKQVFQLVLKHKQTNSHEDQNSKQNPETGNQGKNKPKIQQNDEQSNSKQYKYVYDDTKKDYYSSLEGLKGDELFKAVYKNQQKYLTELSSKSSYSNLYNIYSKAFIDKYYENDGTILDIYSEVADGDDPYEFPVGYYEGSGSKGHLDKKSNGEGFKYNREHMIPQSWFEKVEPTKFDAHFVWPSDKKVNEWRGNNPHFNVQSPTKTSLNGTKIGKKYTEPVNIFKGDTARAYFYFQITHKNATHGKSEEVFEKAYPYFSDQFLTGYKNWANLDPVDVIEADRNNIIAEYEGGLRNPFIDYPELIELIWGDSSKKFVNKGVLKTVENIS